MHPQQEPRPVGDCSFVIGDPGAIGRADFAQNGARFRHHVGDAERIADFDQFSTRNDDFSAFGKSIQRQQHCGRVVVDDDRGDACLRIVRDSFVQQFLEQTIDMDVPLAASTGCEIKLKIGIGQRPYGECDRWQCRSKVRGQDWYEESHRSR